MLTDSGAEGRNPLSKGEECRGGHRWQFLSPLKCWCVSMCSCPACLRQRGEIMNIFFLFWPIEDVGHVESVLWKISDGFPYWLHIQWRGRAPWQFFGGTASHLLTHLVCLLGILQSPSLLLQHNGLFQLNSINSSYLFCSLSQMWQFEVEAVAHAGELHTVENLCLEIWNY